MAENEDEQAAGAERERNLYVENMQEYGNLDALVEQMKQSTRSAMDYQGLNEVSTETIEVLIVFFKAMLYLRNVKVANLAAGDPVLERINVFVDFLCTYCLEYMEKLLPEVKPDTVPVKKPVGKLRQKALKGLRTLRATLGNTKRRQEEPEVEDEAAEAAAREAILQAKQTLTRESIEQRSVGNRAGLFRFNFKNFTAANVELLTVAKESRDLNAQTETENRIQQFEDTVAAVANQDGSEAEKTVAQFNLVRANLQEFANVVRANSVTYYEQGLACTMNIDNCVQQAISGEPLKGMQFSFTLMSKTLIDLVAAVRLFYARTRAVQNFNWNADAIELRPYRDAFNLFWNTDYSRALNPFEPQNADLVQNHQPLGQEREHQPIVLLPQGTAPPNQARLMIIARRFARQAQ